MSPTSVISRIDPLAVLFSASFARRTHASDTLDALAPYDTIVTQPRASYRPSAPSRNRPDDDGDDPRYRPSHRHHPIRAMMRVIADVFIILWALINMIANWPQEWNAIKDTLIWVYIIAVWALHHLGIALIALMVARR